VSPSGAAVYVPGTFGSDQRRLVAVDSRGTVTPFAAPSRHYAFPRFSPDGRNVVVTIDAPTPDLWLYDISAGTLRQITFDAGATNPVWTPDGQRVAFSSNSGPARNLFWIPTFQSAQAERLSTSEHPQLPGSWSPDGRTLAFVERDPANGRDIRLLPMAGDRTSRPLLDSPFDEGAPRFSPDGRLLAYVSNESGRSEVFVRSLAAGRGVQVSSNGGTEPVWARDGARLFYRHGGQMADVPVQGAAPVRVGPPHMLFEDTFTVGTLDAANYDVADGDRFLMVQPETQSAARDVHVLVNWASVLGPAPLSTR